MIIVDFYMIHGHMLSVEYANADEAEAGVAKALRSDWYYGKFQKAPVGINSNHGTNILGFSSTYDETENEKSS